MDFKFSFSFCREQTNVLQNIASVMTCVRQHETNSRWLMELLGQIENAVNKKTESDNQQVSTATVVPNQHTPPASFKSHILKTRINTHTCTHKKVYTRAVQCRWKVTLMFNYTFLLWVTYFFLSCYELHIFFYHYWHVVSLFSFSVYMCILWPFDFRLKKFKIRECSNY